MSVENPEELAALAAAGRVVSDTLRAMQRAVHSGVTTRELDEVAMAVFRRAGARSGPQLDYGFPGATCISVNDEVVHGIPSSRRLVRGDLVKLDVTAELDSFYSDACITVSVDQARPRDRALVATAQKALAKAIRTATAGAPLNAIGGAVEKTVLAGGHSVCRQLVGHAIGRRIHEEPQVPNYFVPQLSQPLTEGLVLTIEPIISAGSGAVRDTGDGWTIRTADGSRAAHVEHTIVIRDGEPLILTA